MLKEIIYKLFSYKKRIISFSLAGVLGVISIISHITPIVVEAAVEPTQGWCLDGGLVWSNSDVYQEVFGALVEDQLKSQLYWAIICATNLDVVNTINNQITLENSSLISLEYGTEAINREYAKNHQFPDGILAAASNTQEYVDMYNRGKGYTSVGSGSNLSLDGKAVPEWYIGTTSEQPYILKPEDEYSVKVPAGSEDFWDYAVISILGRDGEYHTIQDSIVNDTGWTYFISNGVCKFSYNGLNSNPIPQVKFRISQRAGSPYQLLQGVNANTLYEFPYMRWYVCVKVGSYKPQVARQRLYNAKWPQDFAPSVAYIATTRDPIDFTTDFEIYRHEETMEADYNLELYKYDYETGKPLEGVAFDILQSFPDKDQITDEDGAETITSENTLYTPTIWDGFKIFDSRKTDANGKITISNTRRYQYSKTYCDGHVKPQEPIFEGDDDDEAALEAYEADREAYELALEKWQNEVAECERVANEYHGIHFHWLTDSDTQPSMEEAFVQSGVEADCEATYEKFINLNYTYAVRESIARDGYILHDIHNDDIPIEIITTNSSQAGAKATFANGYSRDIGTVGWANVSWNASAGSGSSSGSGIEDIDTEEVDIYGIITAIDTIKKTFILTENGGNEVSFNYKNAEVYYYGSNKIKIGDEAVIAYVQSDNQPYEAVIVDLYEPEGASAFLNSNTFSLSNISKAIKTFIVNILFGGQEEISDKGDFDDSEIMEVATPSNSKYKKGIDDESIASPSNGEYEIEIVSNDVGKEGNPTRLRDDTGGSTALNSDVDILGFIERAELDGIEHLDEGQGSGNLSHIWRIYNHRTEGEIHFNKKDLNLYSQKDEYESYGSAQGDGTLEGAVYGLFASMDITHPDGKTGVVYKAGDLVAIAATDRNGDGSFMAATEAPGMTYDYSIGGVKKRTDIEWDGPVNLYTEDIIIDDYDKDGTYTNSETGLTSDTKRFYTNNRTNNGNEWIGRPLILGNYYIKELSRSEGYELSINGQADMITNKNSGIDDSAAIDDSILYISQSLSASNMESNVGNGEEFTFKITSKDRGEAGYDISIKGLPDGLTFYRQDEGVERGEYERPTGNYVKELLYETDGSPKWRTAESNYSDLVYENGELKIVDVEMSVTVTSLSGMERTIMDLELVAEAFTSEGNYDDGRLAELFSLDTGDVNNNKFVKYKVEKALRANGYTTPYDQGGYSNLISSVFDRGVREGDIDYYGVSGVTPGQVAERTVYGAAASILIINKDATLTNRMVMDAIIEYYSAHNYYTYGGVDSIRDKGTYWEITLYNDLKLRDNTFFTFTGTADTFTVDTVFYRRPYIPADSSLPPRYTFASYTVDGSDIDGTAPIGTFETINTWSTTLVSGKTTARGSFILHPDSKVEDNGDIVPYVVKQNVYYKKGELIYDKNGERIQDYQWVAEMEIVEGDIYTTKNHVLDAQYIDGEYRIHIDTKYLDEYGVQKDDIDVLTTLNFFFMTDKSMYTLTQEDIDLLSTNKDGYEAGDEIAYSDYLFTFKRAAVVITNDMGEDSYIKPITLSYSTQTETYQDAGTRTEPIGVLERPIKQPIKIIKKIKVNEDGSYSDNTYGNIHQDAFTSEYGSSTDATNIMDNFRFKVYLKSNLERLYRDESGKITWLDRNSNEIIPEYQDTNGSGTYNTFVWKDKDDQIINFPEVALENQDNEIESVNVQKIFTKAEHNTASTTTGDRSNNVWATYQNPQTGEIKDVGEKQGYTTSLYGEDGNAVYISDSLYSYNGKNTNVKKTDKVNENQNGEYIRILETTIEQSNDGAGNIIETKVYNYDKFFAAIHVANIDKWDNDLVSGKENYPGQNWFDTFAEEHQKEDKNTSFKPFQWIRKYIFGVGSSSSSYPVVYDNENIENEINTSDFARKNAQASDAVRQFAIDWHLKDEAAKLLVNNGYDEDVAKDIIIETDGTVTVKEYAGTVNYSEEIYDIALYNALEKTYNYLTPFFDYDLDTIYSVVIDSEANGGADNDNTTLNVNLLEDESGAEYYYGVTAYLPYGDYVVVEQQPSDIELGDFANKHYQIDAPKEVSLPTVYAAGDTDELNPYFNYNAADTPEQLAEKYLIRFNEEWADNHTDDVRSYIIRAHNHNGDFEVYKYGLDVDKITNATLQYSGGTYTSDGYVITQDEITPLKRYYNDPLVAVKEAGGSKQSTYFADDKDYPAVNPNAHRYQTNEIEKIYRYGSISEHAGVNHGVVTMTGIKTAYDGQYASTLVPWSVTTPIANDYDPDNFTGYADVKFQNVFYKTQLRIEKIDSETGENILHDGAIFALYAASRYTNQEEVDRAIANGAAASTKIGDVKFYSEDTWITGSYEFLKAMGADNIKAVSSLRIFGQAENNYTGMVPAKTPICEETEQIILYDEIGVKTGEMTVYTTTNDVEMVNEEDGDKAYHDQNTGYFVTPQPLGAGVYVLAELKPPAGYAKSTPIAIEIYSDGVSYYINGDIEAKVNATIYRQEIEQ